MIFYNLKFKLIKTYLKIYLTVEPKLCISNLFLQPDTGNFKNLFSYSHSEPVMTPVHGRDGHDDIVLLCYENKTLFYNSNGRPDSVKKVEWSSTPHLICKLVYTRLM